MTFDRAAFVRGVVLLVLTFVLGVSTGSLAGGLVWPCTPSVEVRSFVGECYVCDNGQCVLISETAPDGVHGRCYEVAP